MSIRLTVAVQELEKKVRELEGKVKELEQRTERKKPGPKPKAVANG